MKMSTYIFPGPSSGQLHEIQILCEFHDGKFGRSFTSIWTIPSFVRSDVLLVARPVSITTLADHCNSSSARRLPVLRLHQAYVVVGRVGAFYAYGVEPALVLLSNAAGS